jgi:hypothetical protein
LLSQNLSPPPFPTSDQRAGSPRKNLLLAANVDVGSFSAPVRIRNLSETGALIDGTALPEVGADLTLRRLEIEVGATVVWRVAGRCGIRFAGKVSVDDWATGKRRMPTLFERSQTGVDARQAAVRSGKFSLVADDDVVPAASLAAEVLDGRIADELAELRCTLDTVGDALSDDVAILQQHGDALQQLDVACQILTELGAILGAKDRGAALAAVKMHALRARLSRA